MSSSIDKSEDPGKEPKYVGPVTANTGHQAAEAGPLEKMNKKRKIDKVDKDKSLDTEAGATRSAIVMIKATDFHCFRCDCSKKAKRTYVWKTSQGNKVVCNGCHGFLTTLARSPRDNVV
jgi:hypothetical protein